MSRLELLPVNDFATQFKKLMSDVEQIKGAQATGKDIFVPKIVQCYEIDGVTPTVYDLVAPSDGFGGFYTSFVASMMADNQDEVWAVPIFQILKNNPIVPAVPSVDHAGGFCYLDFPTTYDKSIGYTGSFTGDSFYGITDLYLKVYFYATDTGTLSVAAI